MSREWQGLLRSPEALAGACRRDQSIRQYQWGRHLNAASGSWRREALTRSSTSRRRWRSFQNGGLAWPDTSLTHRYIGYAYANAGKDDEAIAAYTKAWQIGKDLDAYKRVALIHINRGTTTRRSSSRKQRNVEVNASLVRSARTCPKTTRQALGGPDQIRKGARNTKQEGYLYNKYNLTVKPGQRQGGLDHLQPGRMSRRSISTNYKKAFKEYTAAITMLTEARDYSRRQRDRCGCCCGVRRCGPDEPRHQGVPQGARL